MTQDTTIEAAIKELEGKKGKITDFMERLEIEDKILELKKSAGMIKPPDSPYMCEGCGS
jgi:acetolactate synthase small subunit